jgi:peptide chain release factor 2
MDEIKQRVNRLIERLEIDNKKEQIKLIEEESSSADFWKDNQEATEKMKELARLQKELEDISKLQLLISEGKAEETSRLLDELESILYLSGPFDKGNAILALHAGQGGVEAMDWTQMLFRMYSRYCERKGWQCEIIDQTLGEEAGFKSITISIDGDYAYGYLKHEAGTHRLVRQSPFNADNLRQTSFALVEVLPDIEEGKVEIKDDDLEWDFYRASSHGGQNVQKVSSAVRLRHKPTAIVVTAQSERYQAKNREFALKLLRGKLWQLQDEERRKKEEQLKGGYKMPGWGNQIRSYVLHPYHMIKDLRTNFETAKTDTVLDGDLDSFIDEELRKL